ncbi:MAG: aminotransferase class I/II-fold pyridoxal phosphate-dependent enzyme, partial [Deltaproteobacteria bacterium]|nr:aminotransferase class I/II-fold pyridoxal phosphate-dependent enzyme [Deltaproteobacteria bacterium]
MSASRTPSRAQAQAEARRLVGEHVERLIPYPPGKPIEELERELGLTGSIKLASNENPLGPSPRAVEALARALTGLHRYPDGSAFYLKQRLAAHHEVTPEEVIVGNGSNEIIELLIKTFVGPEEEVLFAEQSFAVYPIAAQSAGARWVAVPLRDYTHDLEAMADRIGRRTKLVFIANPNNPTGTIVRREAFERFLGRVPDGVIIGLDEAYFEYVTDPEFPDGLRYRDRGPLLVAMRTFS